MKRLRSQMSTQELETLTAISAFLLVLSLLFNQRLFVIVSLSMLIIALFIKPMAHIISDIWLGFAEILGKFNSIVILTILYFAVLTPMAIFCRVTNRNPLRIKHNMDSDSYFDVQDHLYSRSDLEKMW